MTLEEIRKKYGINTTDKKTTQSEEKSTGGKMTLDEIRKKYGLSSGVDQDYINSFVADTKKYSSADMADSYRVWNELDLGSRANAIRGWLDQNKSSYTDKDAYQQFSDAIDNYLNIGKEYSSFADEKAYGDWYKSYQAEEEYKANFENIDAEKASQGWHKYLADEETAKNAPKHDVNGDGKEAWWETALGLFSDVGYSADTTLPTAGVTQTIHDLRNDEYYNKRPEKDWTEEQKNAFGQLYLESPALAYMFAEDTNNRNAKKKEEDALKKIAESATSNFGAGLGHTIGAIATAPLGMADFFGDLAMANAGREIAPDGNVSPFEYSQAVTGGITEHLNEMSGTLNDNIPIIGGKGLGDFYGLGTSIAQSMASAYTFGPGGTLVAYFGQGAASAMDDALARGVSDWQAALYGTALGAFEGIAESIGIDNLFKLGASTTIKGFLKNVLKQAGAEGMEEGLTALLSNIADNAIMQDKSNFNRLVAQYMAQGMSESEAKEKAWWDSIEGIAFDTIAGAASGEVSGSFHTSVQNIAYNSEVKKHGQTIIEKGGVDPLRNLSYEVAESMEKKDSKEINRLANKVGKKASARNVGKLSAQLEGKITKQNRAAFESALEKNGLSKKEAKLATDYLLDSEDLSYADKYTIENDERFQKAIDAVSVDPDLGVSNGMAELYAARGGKNLNEVLNSAENSDTMNESEVISDESTDGIHLRNGSERNDGQNTEESVFDLESSTGKNKSWRKAEQFADGEAARLVNEGREVSVASLGILRGSDKHTVRLVDEGNETPTMKQARARASERGLNVKFFVGDNLVIADDNGKLFAARGYILGNTMLVRADHPYYTSDQITRHEIGHDMIAKGEVNIKDIRDKLIKTVGEENVDSIAEHYATAYEGTNLTPEEIWEECICDSLGDMNIFAGDKTISEFMSPAMSEVKAATESTTKSPTQTRGSHESEGKAKSDTESKTPPAYLNNNKAKGKNGWSSHGSPEDAVYAALEYVNSDVLDAVYKEHDSGKDETPVINAVSNVGTAVRQEIISPMQAAELVSQAYKKGGVDALKKVYTPQSIEVYNKYLLYFGGVGKASTELKMSPQDYRNYGWVRDNDVINSGYWANFTKNFSQAVTKLQKYPKSKSGEFMIAVYDESGASEIADVIVFAKGTIESPVVTKIIQIYEYDGKKLDKYRRYLYDLGRRGIQPEVGEFFELYRNTDFTNNVKISKSDGENDRYSEQFGTYGRTSSTTTEGNIGKASRELDSLGNELTNEQIEYFKNSKVRDANGNLLVVRHGTETEFNIFDFSKAGKNGKAEGYGFYFSDEMEITKRYGSIQKEVYLNITKPLYNNKRTITKAELKKLVNALIDFDLKKYSSDGLIWQDSFLSNYLDTYEFNKSRQYAVQEFINQIWEYNDNDQDLVFEVAQADGRMYESATMQEFYDVLGKSIGYDGIIAEWSHPDGNSNVYVTFRSEQSKNVSNKAPTSNPDIRFSRELDTIDYIDEQAEREGTERVGVEPLSNREILANALESIAQNEIEQNKLKEYKANISKMNTESAKLAELKKEIKELTFGKGEKNPEKLKALNAEATKTENRINLYDKKLLSLETASVLKDVLEREKRKAYSRAAQKGREAMHRNVEGRRKTEMRHKINKVAHELDALLNRGAKERNVKKGQSELVRRVLDLSDMLFATDDELIVGGIETDLSDREKLAVAEFKALYDEYHSYDESVTENKEKRKELRTQMNEKKKELTEALERERKRISKAKASGIFDALAKEYEALKNSEYSYIRNAFEKDTLEHIKKLGEDVGDTLVKDMTLGQMESIYKAFRMVKTMVSDSNKLFNEEIKESAEKMGQKALSEVRSHGHKEGFTKPGKAVSEFAWNNLKPIYLMERIGSKTLQDLFQNILNAESEWAKFTAESQAFIEEQKKKFGYDKWDLKKKWTFKTETGLEYELNLEQMFSIYAYAKRGDQALGHLQNDGFVFDKVTIKKKGVEIELNDKTAYKVTNAALEQIFGEDGILTEDQKAFVDAMQKYLSDDLAKRGNAVSNKLYGIDLFGEEYYLGIRSEGAYLERAREQNKGTAKMKNRGFTKSTQKNARNAIVLSEFTDLWSGHVIEMNEYAAFTLPLEDFYRVYNYQNDSSDTTNKTGVIPAIDNAYGEMATKAIDRLLEDINGGAKTDYVEGAGKKLIGLFKKAKVMLSLSVIVQQPSAIVRAMSIINPKYFVGQKTVKTEPKLWEEVKKYAPVAIIKEMGYFDTGLGYTAKEWVRGNKTFKDWVDDIISWAPAKADEITWRAIWKAVKRETLHNNPKMNPTSDEFLKLCGKRFEEVIRHTQVYDSTLSRSANMRSKSVFMQMVTSFMAEPTTSINMLEMAVRSGNGKRIGVTAAAVYGSYLLNAILVALPYAMRDDDEDETFTEKYLSALTESFISNSIPLTALPLVKDIWSIAQGYDVERADMALISDFVDSFVSLATESMKEDSDPGVITEIIVDMVGGFANLTGIPLKNVVRDVKGIINFAQTLTKDFATERNTTWNSLADALEQSVKESIPIYGRLTQESKADKLFDAIMAGDKNYTERLKDSYSSEGAYESAIRKTIGEKYRSGEITRAKAMSMLTKYGDYDENDAYWKLKEWDYEKKYGKDAEWSKYSEFYTAVKTGKNLKAVIKDYIDHGVSKESLASQITSYYKPLYKKMSKAQRASLKGYLLNAYQLLGYKRADKSKDIDNWLKDK